jgi:hypothetical protein
VQGGPVSTVTLRWHDPDYFTDLYGQARERVLTRYAAQATDAAAVLRDRAPNFPQDAVEMLAEAANLTDYARRCTQAAADSSLPTPGYKPLHPVEDDDADDWSDPIPDGARHAMPSDGTVECCGQHHDAIPHGDWTTAGAGRVTCTGAGVNP